MMAGQHWSAATSSEFARSRIVSVAVRHDGLPAIERVAPYREPGDGEQEVGGLGRVGRNGGLGSPSVAMKRA
jgi:hypothetical protein